VIFRHTGLSIEILGYGFELSLGFFGWMVPGRGHRYLFPWIKTHMFHKLIYTDRET
jgi:hypothetical protein